MRRNVISVAAIAGAVGVAVGGLVLGGDGESENTAVKTVSGLLVAAPAMEVALPQEAGDNGRGTVFVSPAITTDRRPLGTLQGYCPGTTAGSTSTECVLTYTSRSEEGTLVLEGTYTGTARVRTELAVRGGTGAFNAARGRLIVEPDRGGLARFRLGP